jgi:hypothetical protein
MLGVIGYIFLALVASVLLVGLFNALRPVKNQGEGSIWRPIIVFWIVVMAAPYVYAELNTRMYGDDFSEAVDEVIADIDINGGLEYYKVTFHSSTSARVIAVAYDEQVYGNDRPILSIALTNGENGWQVDDYRFISKFDKGHDGVSIPPYW